MRINEVLKEQSNFSMEDMQYLQNDYVSTHAREVVPYLLHAFDSVTVTDPDVKVALEYFRTWNFEMRKEDVTTALFNVTFTKIIENTFRYKMGDRLFALFDTIASTPIIVTTQLLKNNNSIWFDDPRTPNIETRDDIIRKSLQDAITDLRSRLGGEVKEWQWGRLHTVTFEHVFGQNSLLKSFFSVGPFAVGGDHSTVNVGQYLLASSYESTVGASMRQIFNLADINDTRVVMPPGQSGQVFSPHYRDQAMLWLNGVYRTRPMEQSAIHTACSDVLILKPVK
jgi:penicillin amidase